MTMTSRTRICGGVDTHLDTDVAAALDERGGLLGVESFETTLSGYAELYDWLAGFGEVELVGVEGTGSYGAGLTRLLHSEGVRVVEVDRPNRQRRRSRGKSDPQDAISAARAAQSGDCAGEAKTRDGQRGNHASAAPGPELGAAFPDRGVESDAVDHLHRSRRHPCRAP